MAIAVVAKINNVVFPWALVTKRCWSCNKLVVVKKEGFVFSITVVDNGGLGHKTKAREILPIRIHSNHIILADIFCDVVEATVSVFFQAPEVSNVVLKDIVVSIAK